MWLLLLAAGCLCALDLFACMQFHSVHTLYYILTGRGVFVVVCCLRQMCGLVVWTYNKCHSSLTTIYPTTESCTSTGVYFIIYWYWLLLILESKGLTLYKMHLIAIPPTKIVNTFLDKWHLKSPFPYLDVWQSTDDPSFHTLTYGSLHTIPLFIPWRMGVYIRYLLDLQNRSLWSFRT